MTTLVNLPAIPGGSLGCSSSSSRERDDKEEWGRDILDPSLEDFFSREREERDKDDLDILCKDSFLCDADVLGCLGRSGLPASWSTEMEESDDPVEDRRED